MGPLRFNWAKAEATGGGPTIPRSGDRHPGSRAKTERVIPGATDFAEEECNYPMAYRRFVAQQTGSCPAARCRIRYGIDEQRCLLQQDVQPG